MKLLGRLRWGAAYPLYAVALSAALFVVVALSIALQPPDGRGSTLSGALAWANALFFSGGAALLVLAVVGYARPRQEALPEMTSEPDVRAFALEPDESMYTLIAMRMPGEEPAGIADFVGAGELLAAIRRWRQLYPDEELRVFGPDGAELARRAPVEAPVPTAVAEPPARLLLRRRVSSAAGGV